MDPQTQQPTFQQTNGSFVDPTQRGTSFFKNKLLILVIILIVALGAIGGLWFILRGQSQNTAKTPSEEQNVVLATIGTTKITKDYVRNIALESYVPTAITNDVIKQQLDIAIERVLLEKEALKKNIVLPKNVSKSEYYSLLKNKVTEGQILSVEEQDISWWIPPTPDYEQRPEFAEQRSVQQEMANEIERRLANDDDPLTVAKDMIVKYPVFANILGYNGQIVKQIDQSTTSASRTVQYDAIDAEKPFFNLLYSMGSNEIRSGIWENGSGGAVIKTGTVTSGAKIDYAKWLADQIKLQVKYNTEEISKL